MPNGPECGILKGYTQGEGPPVPARPTKGRIAMAKLLSLADARSRISSGGCDRDIARYYACGPERPEQQAHYRNRFLTAIARFQEISRAAVPP